MTACNDFLQVFPILCLIFKRPAAAPGDPDPVELRFLEQPQHLVEIPVIDMRQHILLFGAELSTPPGPLGLPTLKSSPIQTDKTKIPLLRPWRHVLRLGTMQLRWWFE